MLVIIVLVAIQRVYGDGGRSRLSAVVVVMRVVMVVVAVNTTPFVSY